MKPDTLCSDDVRSATENIGFETIAAERWGAVFIAPPVLGTTTSSVSVYLSTGDFTPVKIREDLHVFRIAKT
jgi:hypothetical protein